MQAEASRTVAHQGQGDPRLVSLHDAIADLLLAAEQADEERLMMEATTPLQADCDALVRKVAKDALWLRNAVTAFNERERWLVLGLFVVEDDDTGTRDLWLSLFTLGLAVES
jgi:hypothetical protein